MAYGLKACSFHPLTCWEIEINHCFPPPPPTHTPMDGYGASRCGFPYSQTNIQRTREGGISLTVRETATYVCRRGVKKLSPCDFLLKIVALSSKSNFFFFFLFFLICWWKTCGRLAEDHSISSPSLRLDITPVASSLHITRKMRIHFRTSPGLHRSDERWAIWCFIKSEIKLAKRMHQ